MSADWRQRLKSEIAESRISWDASLTRAITLRIGGPAECLVELESERELTPLFQVIGEYGLPFHVLGKGSNVLVRDEGLPGVVIRLGDAFRALKQGDTFRGLSQEDAPHTVTAGAALSNGAFVEGCRKWRLGGMEYLVAIPGSIGGAIAMNAGAHDGETAGFLRTVRVFTDAAGLVDHPAGDFEFAYRASPLRGNEGRLVLGGVFAMHSLQDGEMRERQERMLHWRREHQPRDFPNCGSVFKNPPGDFAARLIDESGLKGHCVGGAQVSEKHANFIVNRGRATAGDVLKLIDFIQETVYSRSGVQLELELQIFPLDQGGTPSHP